MQQQFQYIRKWLGQQKENTFRFMSYNILANSLLQESEQQNPYYQWNNRWSLILKQIKNYKPDILCLQEMDYNEIELSQQLEQEKYEKLYLKRNGQQLDGCAIFYQKNKYKLLNQYNLYQKQEHIYVNEQKIMDKPNICLIAVLQQINNINNPIIIANSHLLFNKNRGDLKLCQIQLIMLALQQLQQKYQNSKLIWCGDFNLTPNSALYRYISQGELDFRYLNPRLISGQSSINYWPNNYYQDRVRIQQKCGQFQGKYEYTEEQQYYDIYTQSLRCEILNNELIFKQAELNAYPIVETPIKFQSVYSQKQQQMKNNLEEFYAKWSTYEPLITTMSESQVGCVDYIWINQLQIAQILQTPKIQYMIENPLINNIEGSDHIPLICDLY